MGSKCFRSLRPSCCRYSLAYSHVFTYLRALRALMPHVHCALRALVPHMSRAQRALVLHMPRALGALVSRVTCALSALMLHINHALHALLLTTMIYNLFYYSVFFFISDISLQDPFIFVDLNTLIHQPAFIRKSAL